MPLDSELSQRLERRRVRADDGTDVAEVKVEAERSFEAPIDQELRSKLRQQSANLSRPKASAGPEKATEAQYEARIDEELAKKIKKRQTDLEQMEGRGEANKAAATRPAAEFGSHIDPQLAAKLKKRSTDIEQKQAQVSPTKKQSQATDAEDPLQGPMDQELVQKLRQRRNVVNTEGAHFEKEEDGSISVSRKNSDSATAAEHAEEVQSALPQGLAPAAPETKRRKRYWWLFCCGLVAAGYGAYQMLPLD
ncbi:unnamed protein product [Symbiodinium sp. CCMP2456]|nr:unnamed protein product [Symbiodinium sp. CCMP2456]